MKTVNERAREKKPKQFYSYSLYITYISDHMIIVLLYSLLPDYYCRDFTARKHFGELSGSAQWGALN